MDTKSIFDDELCNDFEDYKFNDIVYDNKTGSCLANFKFYDNFCIT